MGTPDERSVPSVRVNRATAIFRRTSPTMGMRSIARWMMRRPLSFRYISTPVTLSAMMARITSGRYVTNASDTAMTMNVIFGELVLAAEVLEDVLERGDDPPEQDAADAEEDHEHDARVDHRPAELPLQLDGLLVVDGETLEDRVEDAAGLARLNEVAVEGVEHRRMPPERLAERLTLLDLGLDVEDDDLECGAVRLVREDVEALHDGQARVDHRGEEARECDEVLLADAAAEREAREGLALLLDLGRDELLLTKARLHGLLVIGLHLALSDLAGRATRFPDPLRHVAQT